MERISSRQNALVRKFRELAGPGAHGGQVLLDGEHLIADALAAGVPIELAAVDDRYAASPLAATLEGRGVRTITVTPPVLAAISPVRQPSGITALARLSARPLQDLLDRPDPLVAVLADVQDPGNVGAIVRAAEACGATGVVTTAGAADPFGWKALRGSMGSALRVPIAVRQALPDAIAAARAAGLRIIATAARGGTALPDADLRGPCAILIGGEGAGLPESIAALADERVTIPMAAPVESMNAATAAAIVLYEALRQRRRPGQYNS